MADVTLSYKGDDILELSDSGSATLKTGGKYCEDDIAVEYVKPSGGDTEWNVIEGVSNVTLLWYSPLSTNYKIKSQALDTISFGVQSAIEKVTVEADAVARGLTVSWIFSANQYYSFKEANFNFIPLYSFSNAFNSNYGADKIPYFESCLGLNFSKCGGRNYAIGNMFTNCGALKNVTVKPNSLGQLDLTGYSGNALQFRQSSLLTDQSLVSIANGFCALHTSTLNLHATPKAKLSTITGTVSQVTDDTGTYDFFTADENGTVTLLDFITNTKGWTVA